MSTTATTVDMSTKPELITFALIEEKIADGFESDGTTPRYKSELRAASREKDIADAKLKNQVLVEQSFSFDMPGTFEGILEVIPDKDEALQIFKAGYKTRINSRTVALMTETDADGNPAFQAVEGNYDIRALLQEPAQKRNLSPMDKAVKALSGIPGISADMVAALIAQVREGMANQAVSALSGTTAE